MSGTTEPVAQIQSHLSEDLFLLRSLSTGTLSQRTYSPLPGRLLDTVALFLATGESNPTIATFWWEKDAKLYIAKSPSYDSQRDATVAEIFFNNLKQAQGFESMIPFLATYGQASVNKRIRHLRQSLSMASYDCLFNNCHDPKDPLNCLKSIISDSKHPFVFDASKDAISTFKELVVNSRRVLDVHTLVFSTRHDLKSACYLQRHLDKMAQYLHVRVLIKFWKKHGRNIEISWVPDVTAEMRGADAAHTMTMKTILSRHLSVIRGEFMSSPEELRDYVFTNFQRKPSITINPHVHAEIQLILHVSENVGFEHLKGSSELLIGSNKTSCFACTCWRNQFNSALDVNWETTSSYKLINFDMTWKTISSNSLPRSDWAIPRDNNILPSPTIDSSILRGCNEAVLSGIQSEVRVLLEEELISSDDSIADMKSGY